MAHPDPTDPNRHHPLPKSNPPPLPRRRRPPCAFGRLEVNDIFKDLGNLVVEQGEMLDSIEYNMTATSTHVEHGREELGKASRYQVCAWTHR